MRSKVEAALSSAGQLYNNLKADIENASTRLEHVRITALAQEAENLYGELQHLLNGIDDAGSADSSDASDAGQGETSH